MSSSLDFQTSPPDPPSIEQESRGDQNQIIGQAVSSTIVNVTGHGQVTIYQSQLERTLQCEPPTPTTIGSNPYKGLSAFQETEGDYFFGREKQIEQLWQKFRDLHDNSEAVRLLPIYGPSGSGKSSLARAGLIPELARRPLPGRNQARVAILVPGTHPLEALATVLARVATDDPIPVAKTREFAGELAQVSPTGDYDGLRRIANVLPNIVISPLIVVVDQFEEIYTLCGDGAAREAFVSNLLCAASDQSQQVSVIITLRSDFLGEAQKHALLNCLLSQQGFLVPAMDETELRQVIRKPAELAGHPLDEATVNLLIEQTQGREGALPLLQFALTRIWEGLTENMAPAMTLERIGGVGGALAGEAQRVYESLTPDQQTIARRLFLGMVQLGEGTRDTRRRAVVSTLVSCKHDLSQVKQVLSRFADPSVRLVTCASSDGIETAEVTHEALIDHWQILHQWLDQSRSDVRYQRRLEEDARHWNQNGRPDGNLRRPPDLDFLRRYYQRVGDDMSPLQVEFFKASEHAEHKRKRLQKLVIGGLVAGSALTTGLAIFAIYQLQQAQRQRVEQLATAAEALVTSQPTNAVFHALAAVGLSRKIQFHPVPPSAFDSLLISTQFNRERKLMRHETGVWSAVFSPDGQIVASGSRNGAIHLWNAKTGEPIEELRGHESTVDSIAFSPDGKLIASSSEDKTIRLWDADTNQPIAQLQGHEGRVTSVAFSPDSKLIVSGSRDKTIRLWDVNTKQPIGQPLRGHQAIVWEVAFSPDRKTIVSSGEDATLRIWNVNTRQPIGQPLRGHKEDVTAMALSPDGKLIASGSWDKTIRLWNAITGQPIAQLEGHEKAVISLAFSPDSRRLVSGSTDFTVRLWDAGTGQQIGEPLRGHEDAVSAVGFSPDGKTVVSSGRDFSSSQDRSVRLWDISNSKQIGQPLLQSEEIWSIDFSPDGKTLVSGGRDHTVRLWNAETGQPIRPPLQGHENIIWSVAFSPNGQLIASGSGDNTIRLWNASTGQPFPRPLWKHQNEVTDVVFSPDGRTLISSSDDQTIRLWDVSNGKLIEELKGQAKVRSLAASSDGRTVAGGYGDGTVGFWDIKTGQLLQAPLRKHEGEIWAVAFSPDGSWLISGGEDGAVQLWDVKTATPIGEPFRHDDAVTSVAFSPDGKIAASSSRDQTLRLWDVKAGKLIGQPLRGHEATVTFVTFSPDGQTVASSDTEGTVGLWNQSATHWQELLQVACEQLRYHSSLIKPENGDTVSQEAKQTCQKYAWRNE